jgi:hypothetical protein
MSSPRTEPLAEAPRDTSNDTVDPKELQELRRNWKWAAVCDFLWTFNTAMRLDLLNYYVRSFSLFHLVYAPYIALRISMPPATSERCLHPQRKLTLPGRVGPRKRHYKWQYDDHGNRHHQNALHSHCNSRPWVRVYSDNTASQNSNQRVFSSAETWQIYLRRHLAKRDEKNPLLGTDDDPREIKDLTIDQRLGLMHNLCEWQFQDPTRLRQNMGHNDDSASWVRPPLECRQQKFGLFSHRELSLLAEMPSEIPTGSMGVCNRVSLTNAHL